MVRLEGGSADGEHEGVGGRKVHGAHRCWSDSRAGTAGCPCVSRGGDHRHVPVPVGRERRAQLGDSGAAGALLTDPCSDRDDVAKRRGEPQRADEAGTGRLQIAGSWGHEDDPNGGCRGDRVHHLGVHRLLTASQVGMVRMDQARYDLSPDGGQVEQSVEHREVAAKVTGGRRCVGSELQQHDALPAAVDTAMVQGLDAIGGHKRLHAVTQCGRQGGAVAQGLDMGRAWDAHDA